MRRIDSCIAQLEAQGPSRTCSESQEEEDLVVIVSVEAEVEARLQLRLLLCLLHRFRLIRVYGLRKVDVRLPGQGMARGWST